MEWVAARTGETTGGTTAETVETTGGTVGSEVIPTWHDALTPQRAGKRCPLVVSGVIGDLAPVMASRSL
jgi:hypothetical protein